MWKTATYTTPVIFGALRVIKTGLKKCVDNITGTVSIDYLQMVILLGAAHILRSALSIRGTLWQPKPKEKPREFHSPYPNIHKSLQKKMSFSKTSKFFAMIPKLNTYFLYHHSFHSNATKT